MITIILLFVNFAFILLALALICYDLWDSAKSGGSEKDRKGKLPRYSAYGYGAALLSFLLLVFVSIGNIIP